jgi:hypothetical protein
MKKAFLLFTHCLMLVLGFAAGVYFLPIVTQPPAPGEQAIGEVATKALFTGHFERDLSGSDALHYGDGNLYISDKAISFEGKLAPGPDYHLYLSPVFVEDKAAFLEHKAAMKQVGEVRTFNNFLLPLPESVNPGDFNTVVIWCETFNMFITAGQYQ